MINRRRVMGGKKLPYDYEVEYLESTGKQYIDINMPQGELISLEFLFNAPNSTQFLLGRWKDNGANYPSFSFDSYNRFFVSDYITSKRKQLNYGFVANTDMEVTYNQGTLTTNGVVKYTGLSLEVKYEEGTFCLFAIAIPTYIISNGVKIKKFAATTATGSIHLTPVVDYDGVGCMYDSISKQLLYNAGTGSFIIGPRINGGVNT